ncbi:MAG: dicarboxylate/amino acid:cation symporter [Planctomycetes bacterium]|nr:dicarboxylate/amino acid:cation symporter [Planctomycetota bacterium]
MSGKRAGRGLLYAMVAAIVLGIASGAILGPSMSAVKWLGEFFLACLKLLVMPLVITSMVVGIGGLGDVRRMGRIGGITIAYYLTTTGLAVILGIVLVNIIQPGAGVAPREMGIPKGAAAAAAGDVTAWDLLLSLVAWRDPATGAYDANLFRSLAEMNILPIIIVSLIFGAILTTLGDRGRRLIYAFDTINQAIMKMVHLVLFIAPIGIFGLLAARFGEAGGWSGFSSEVSRIGGYTLTVIVGLAIHGLIILPTIVWVFGRRNPFSYLLGVLGALSTAFSTSSSSATLPVTVQEVEESGVSRRTALFVPSLGATINMDGTALYEAVAAIFIAQVVGRSLGLLDQIVIALTATLASIGAAGIPQAGLVTMVIVLQAVGLPLEGTALILTVDWFLDRCRTTVNVWGDAAGASVVDRLAGPDSA